ncbi:MAG: hypothetical protein ABWK05_04205 [Pyrobaculum sp.]
MQSLELAILLGFSLLVVFAAVPYLWQTISANLAVLEARQMLSFMAAFSDSLQSDFGLPGVQRSYYLPNLLFGSFAVDVLQERIGCGNRWVVVNQTVVWYNSSVIIGGVSPIRGPRNYSIANLGAPIAALNASSLGVRDLSARGYVLFTGPVAAVGADYAVVYTYNFTFRVDAFTGRSLTYKITKVETADLKPGLVLSCPGGLYTVEVYRRGSLLYRGTARLPGTLRFVSTSVELS